LRLGYIRVYLILCCFYRWTLPCMQYQFLLLWAWRIIKSVFQTWVYLGAVLYSTMFSLLFLSLNPAMHAISIFAFVSIL
jgi:hypothetical protein